MKKSLLLCGLLFALVACGSKSPSQPIMPPTTTPPSTTYPYNPDASFVQSSDPRTPYYGDWRWVAINQQASNEIYSGVLSITTKDSETPRIKNAGEGLSEWCADGDCKTVNDTGKVGIGSSVSVNQPQLAAQAIQSDNRTERWYMVDASGRVSQSSDGKAEIAGSGTFVKEDGTQISVGVVLEQVSATPSLQASGGTPRAAKPSDEMLQLARKVAAQHAQGQTSLLPTLQ